MFCIEEDSNGIETAGVFILIVNSCVTFTIPSVYRINSIVLTLYSSCVEILSIVNKLIKEINSKMVLGCFVVRHNR